MNLHRYIEICLDIFGSVRDIWCQCRHKQNRYLQNKFNSLGNWMCSTDAIFEVDVYKKFIYLFGCKQNLRRHNMKWRSKLDVRRQESR